MTVYNFFYFCDTTATRECTNTNDHFTNKKTVLHYQIQSTLQHSVLANTWRINCSMDAEPTQLRLGLSMPDKHFYHSSSLVLQSKFWDWIALTAGPRFWHYFVGKSRQVLFKHVSVYFFDLLWHFKKSRTMRLPKTSIKIIYKYKIAQKYIKFLNTIMYILTFPKEKCPMKVKFH